VLTLPHALRYRLAYDGKLLGAVSRIFVDSLLGWYRRRLQAEAGSQPGLSGAVTVLQRCSSDLKLNPHLHVVLLDGVYAPATEGVGLSFHPLSRLSTSEVADVLQVARVRILRYLERHGVIEVSPELTVLADELAEREPALAQLSRAAVSGLEPAGPELRRRPAPITLPNRPGVELSGPLCVQELGFNLHAATRAGAQDEAGKQALLKYVLRPPIASERIAPGPDGLVRIVLKKAFSDGTFAIDLDPLSLLCRLCTSVPAPRLHTVRYAGVLGSHSKYRSLIAPPSEADAKVLANDAAEGHAGQPLAGVDGVELAGAADASVPVPHARYRPWAQLLRATFSIDVEICPACKGRMRMVALVTAPHSVARLLTHLGEPTEPPVRAPARGPPYFASKAVRRRADQQSPQGQLFDE
jgi:hypothetical protein